MRIVVIGGTGLVGSKLVHTLTEHGHDAVAAAPSTGVNTLTGEGLPEVLAGASVVVDVSNSPTLDDAAMEFFRTATTNLLTAEKDAGVGHHVALSVVGTDRVGPAERVLPGEAPAGEAHQRRSHPLLHRARDAVLRVRQDPRRLRDRRRHGAHATGSTSSRWPLPTSRKASLSPRSVTR